jgi:hypothetical protein
MYRVVSNITIIQQPTKDFPTRNKTLHFDFAHEFEANDSWRNLTNTGKIIIPKKLYYRDANNKLQPLDGTLVNIGGFSSTPPLLLRGDVVTIDWGYKYFKGGHEVLESSNDGLPLFSGYISQVTAKKPIEFLVEDNMWKLKQIPAPTHTFATTDTLESILKFLLQGTNFTVQTTTQTTFGLFKIGNETVAEVLARLRKAYRFEFFFRGNTLFGGSLIYSLLTPKTRVFTFQNNIISDELEYRRKDDITLSAVAQNSIEEETGKTNRQGVAKTKKVRLEVLVTFQNGSDTPTNFIKIKGIDYPPNTGGERRTLFFPGAKSIAELEQLAADELRKYYYTGFKGKFTTFGLPFVRMGDNVQLVDTILPERNGTYKVRSVEYTGGMGGLRQNIELDYKII